MTKLFYTLTIISLLLLVISFFSDYWSVKKVEGINDMYTDKTSLGLWRMCFDTNVKDSKIGLDMCYHLPPDNNDVLVNFPKNSLYAIRILCLTSIFLIVSGLTRMYNMSPAGDHRPCIALLSIGAVLYLSGIMIWHNEFTTIRVNDKPPASKLKFKLGSSIHMGITGSILAIIASIVLYRS